MPPMRRGHLAVNDDNLVVIRLAFSFFVVIVSGNGGADRSADSGTNDGPLSITKLVADYRADSSANTAADCSVDLVVSNCKAGG